MIKMMSSFLHPIPAVAKVRPGIQALRGFLRQVLVTLLLFLVSCRDSAKAPRAGTRQNGAQTQMDDVAQPGAEFKVEGGIWRVQLPGSGHSSPAIWNDLVVVTCALANGEERVVLGLDAKNGEELWTFKDSFHAFPQHRFNSSAAATPAIDGERVYLAWPDGNRLLALALDHGGKLLWRRDLGLFETEHGAGSSPILVEDRLVIANDNESDVSALFGLDTRTGEVRWHRPRRSGRLASYASPVPFTSSDGEARILFASTTHGLTCLKPSDGELVWEVDGLFSSRCVATPVITDGIALAFAGKGSAGSESAAVALPGQADAGQVRYRLRRALPYVPSPVAFDGIVFLFNDGGIISAIVSESGEVLWKERVAGEFFGSPIVADGKLYAMSKQGELFILDAASEYHLIAVIDLGERSFATPVLASGVLYLRTEQHLIAMHE